MFEGMSKWRQKTDVKNALDKVLTHSHCSTFPETQFLKFTDVFSKIFDIGSSAQLSGQRA